MSTEVSIFIGSEFWEGLIPEEELPDLLIMFLRKLLVFVRIRETILSI